MSFRNMVTSASASGTMSSWRPRFAPDGISPPSTRAGNARPSCLPVVTVRPMSSANCGCPAKRPVDGTRRGGRTARPGPRGAGRAGRKPRLDAAALQRLRPRWSADRPRGGSPRTCGRCSVSSRSFGSLSCSLFRPASVARFAPIGVEPTAAGAAGERARSRGRGLLDP